MDQTYLPGDARERIIDLMKEKSMTQQELAARTGMTVETLSHFLRGKIGKLGADNLIPIAQIFQVSTDFLLGKVMNGAALTTISENWDFRCRQHGRLGWIPGWSICCWKIPGSAW